MKTYKVPVTFEMCDEIEVHANSEEEAKEKAIESYFQFFGNAEYIDGSLSVNDEFFTFLNPEENKNEAR
jgi:hypothetical protein